MDNTTLIPILSITLPLIGAGLGFLIKHYIDRSKELMSEATKVRRDLYQQFVDLIIDIFAKSKSGQQLPEAQLIDKLYTFYKKYILYASEDVIIAYGDYFQYLYSLNNAAEVSPKAHFTKLTRILLAMRRDLGLKNRNLGMNGEKLFRALIIDFDKII